MRFETPLQLLRVHFIICHCHMMQTRRSIFHEKVGHGRNGRKTWHWDLLIAEGEATSVTVDTTGRRYDWGSGHSGADGKPGNIPKPYGFVYKKAQEHGNTWDYIGSTDWEETKVLELLTILGQRYNVFTNNCHDVTAKGALALVLPTADVSVNDAIARVACWSEVKDVHNIMRRWEEYRIAPENDNFFRGITYEKIDRYLSILARLPDEGSHDTSNRENAEARLFGLMKNPPNFYGTSSWDEAFGSRLGTMEEIRQQRILDDASADRGERLV